METQTPGIIEASNWVASTSGQPGVTPGSMIYFGMPMEEYREIRAINASALKGDGRHSAKHLNAVLEGRIVVKDTEDMKFGRAGHCMVFEPDRFETAFLVSTPCRGITKEKKELCGNQSKFMSPLAIGANDQKAQAIHCLRQCGYEIRYESSTGSVYMHRGLQHVRISDHDPNQATTEWMSSVGCVDIVNVEKPEVLLLNLQGLAGDTQFEPKQFWYCGTHKGKQFTEPVDYISPDEVGRLYRLRDELKKSEANAYLKGPGYGEAVITWNQLGFPLKTRIDKLGLQFGITLDDGTVGDLATVVDLKKCQVGRASYEAAQWECNSRRYHVQAWMIYAGIRAIYGPNMAVEIHFVFIEDNEPFDSHLLTADETDLVIAQRDIINQLSRYRRCEKAGKFDGGQPFIDPLKRGLLPAKVVKYSFSGEA